MKVTSMEELKALMTRLHTKPEAMKSMIAHSITGAASHLAEKLWLEQRKESGDTKEFRRQLLHLNTKGVWAFVKEKS